MKKKLFAPFFLLILIYSCTSENKQNINIEQNNSYEKTPVDVIVAQEQNFIEELYSNGTVKSAESSEMKFKTSGQITEFNVKEGQRVKKGEILAVLDLSEKKTEYEKAKLNLANAQIAYESILLGQGYEISDSAKIPSAILDKAKLKSFYSMELLNLQKAEKELQWSYLRAPFSGIIANIKNQKFAYINSGDVICTIINQLKYDVTFTIFETDFNQVSLNKELEIINLRQDTVKAVITQINPTVSKGLLKLTAQIRNTEGKIMDGMTVKVTLKNPIGRKIVVPRSAVIIRENREVAFTVRNGKAFWNYVTTGVENKDQIVIEKGLNIGDSVIISNNISISHDTEINAQSPLTEK